jgi:NAD(P)H dehydrogenase (quinone)
MASRVLVTFYSMYGHNMAMAKAAVEGAKAAGAIAELRRIPETLPVEVLAKMNAVEAQKAFADVQPVSVNELVDYDAIIVASPTRFGSVPAQVQTFFDQTGGLWFGGKLVGKIGSAMVSSGSQHGGQETTFGGIHKFFLHHGMVVAGLPYTFQGQMGLDEIKGGSPYGATTIVGGQGERLPSAVELEAARYQGNHIASIAAKLARK